MKATTRSSFNIQTTVLNTSLMWFSIGLTAMIGVAVIFGLIPGMQEVSLKLFSNRGFITMLSIGAIGLMIGISFTVRTAKISTLAIMFVLFAIVEGFALSMLLMKFAFEGQTWKILLLFLIPSVAMLVMGVTGYLQIFDFSKISRFLFVGMIGLMVSGIVMYFIMPQTNKVWSLYSMLGFALFTLYVGFDMWRISKLDEILKLTDNPDKEIVTRYGLMFGLSLLIDFIQLIWFLARTLLNN